MLFLLILDEQLFFLCELLPFLTREAKLLNLSGVGLLLLNDLVTRLSQLLDQLHSFMLHIDEIMT